MTHITAASGRSAYVLYALRCGYGGAVVGHLVFENIRPATFERPIHSPIADWATCRALLRGRIPARR